MRVLRLSVITVKLLQVHLVDAVAPHPDDRHPAHDCPHLHEHPHLSRHPEEQAGKDKQASFLSRAELGTYGIFSLMKSDIFCFFPN